MKTNNKLTFYVLNILLLLSSIFIGVSENAKAAPLVCGADDTCINVTLYNFCYDNQEKTPEQRDFNVRLFNASTGKFIDQVVTVDSIIGNTITYVTTFSNLNPQHNFQLRVHYQNQYWTEWTEPKKPTFDQTWLIGEICYPNRAYLTPIYGN